MGVYIDYRLVSENAETSREKMEWFNRTMEKSRTPFDTFRLEACGGKNSNRVCLKKKDDIICDHFYETDEFAYILSKAIEKGEIVIAFSAGYWDVWGYKIRKDEVIRMGLELVEKEKMERPEGLGEFANGKGHGTAGEEIPL